jgi:CRISPR/Cas system CSM-associated protein Csm3 (group 7 of RAMP superfamily)
MRFEIVFHSPFRISSGHAGDGSDSTVDPAALLPASSLKGVMLSAARDLMKFPRHRVDAVFGTAWQESPWGWSDAILATGASIRPRPRIRIEPGTFTVAKGALLVADEVLAAGAEFSIDRIGWIEPGDESWHETTLMAAARAVMAIGGDRRRGSGWVTVTPVEPQWSGEHLRAAAALVGAASQTAGSTGDAEGDS